MSTTSLGLFRGLPWHDLLVTRRTHVARNCEANPCSEVTRKDLVVDSHNAAVETDERAPGVARIDQCIGLDHVVDRDLVRRRHGAVKAATIPKVTLPSSPYGLPMAATGSDPDLRQRTEGEGMRRWPLDLEQREVGAVVADAHARFHFGVVIETNLQ